MVFNGAIDHIIQNNAKARQNPRGLSQLDGYKRGLVNSLTGNLQKFGLERVPKVETLEECSRTRRRRRRSSCRALPKLKRMTRGLLILLARVSRRYYR